MDNIEKMSEALFILHSLSGGEESNGITLSRLRKDLRDLSGIASAEVTTLFDALAEQGWVELDNGSAYLKVNLNDWPSYPLAQRAGIMASWMSDSGFVNTPAAEPTYTPPAQLDTVSEYDDAPPPPYKVEKLGGAIETDEHEIIGATGEHPTLEIFAPTTPSHPFDDSPDVVTQEHQRAHDDDPMISDATTSEMLLDENEQIATDSSAETGLYGGEEQGDSLSDSSQHQFDKGADAITDVEQAEEMGLYGGEEQDDSLSDSSQHQFNPVADAITDVEQAEEMGLYGGEEQGDSLSDSSQYQFNPVADAIQPDSITHIEQTDIDDKQTPPSNISGYGSSSGYGSGHSTSPSDDNKSSSIPSTQARSGMRVMNVDINNAKSLEEEMKELKVSGTNEGSSSPNTPTLQTHRQTSVSPTLPTRPADMPTKPQPPMTVEMSPSAHSEPKTPDSVSPTPPAIKPGGYGSAGNRNTAPPPASNQTSSGYGNNNDAASQPPSKPVGYGYGGTPSQSPDKRGGYGYGGGMPITDDKPPTNPNVPTWGAGGGKATPKPNDSERSSSDGPKLPHLTSQAKNTGGWGISGQSQSQGGSSASNTHIIELALLEAYDDQQIADIADKTRRIRDDIRSSQGDVTIRLELTIYHSAENADVMQARLENFSKRSGFNAKDSLNTLNLRFKLQL